jgi:hypothetical protein
METLMKKYLFLAVVLTLITTLAEAANINKGDWELGGSVSFSHLRGNDTSSTTYRLSPTAQYFLADHFSAGLSLSFVDWTGGGSYFDVGPEFTRYFMVHEQMAPYFSLNPITWTRIGGLSYFKSAAALGLKFFLTDSVAFGPEVEYTYLWKKNQVAAFHNFALQGLFSIHL